MPAAQSTSEAPGGALVPDDTVVIAVDTPAENTVPALARQAGGSYRVGGGARYGGRVERRPELHDGVLRTRIEVTEKEA